MKTRSIFTRLTGGIIVLGLATSSAWAEQYLVKANIKNMDKVVKRIERAGGTITRNYHQIGYLGVEADAGFLNAGLKLRGVQDVMPDLVVRWQEPINSDSIAIGTEFANPPTSGDDDIFFDAQWGHDAVNAPEAWNAGHRGAGVRVAVIDGGFDLDHPDLAPNIDFGSSTDFTGEGLQYLFPDPFSHGSHTSGTIGAADNGVGTIGIAPEVTLILIKSLGDAGSGSFGDVVAGILHAADEGADVLNMSLGATIPRSCGQGPGSRANACAGLLTFTHAAITYAYQSGVAVFASIGNSGRDLDKDKDLIEIPGMGPHHMGIAATTPLGWALDPANADFNHRASYSNWGITGVDFSAPGGSVDYPGNEVCAAGVIVHFCWVLDLVFSVGNNAWYWSAGTSMASPHAAGVAALIISENGGPMKPAHVFRELRNRAEDAGAGGKDPIHGHGAVRTGY